MSDGTSEMAAGGVGGIPAAAPAAGRPQVGRVVLGWAGALAVTGLFWLAAFWYVVRQTERFGEIFADFGTTVPLPTQALLTISAMPWVILVPLAGLLVLLTGAGIGCLWQLRGGKSLKTPYISFSLMGVVIFVVVCMLVLWEPLYSLMNSARQR